MLVVFVAVVSVFYYTKTAVWQHLSINVFILEPFVALFCRATRLSFVWLVIIVILICLKTSNKQQEFDNADKTVGLRDS